jgi:hypothetical protein
MSRKAAQKRKAPRSNTHAGAIATLGTGLFPHDRARAVSGELAIKALAHMLRRACGFALANKVHQGRAAPRPAINPTDVVF